MRPRPRTIALMAVPLLLAALLAGCSSGDWSELHPAPTAVGELGEGFLPTDPPSPEATIDPAAGSWQAVHPTPGMRVVLLRSGEEPEVTVLADALHAWADDESADLREIEIDADDHPIDRIVEALDLHPDLIVSVGNGVVDPLAAVTPSHLDQLFLVVGAELAEPTENVTSVDWTGAAFRGEGLGASSEYDPASFTPERSADAVRAGMAAVLHGETGIVVWID